MTKELSATLGTSIRVQRKIGGLSIAELSIRAGVSAGYISMLENGIAPNPSDEILTKIATGLGADADNLIHLRDPGLDEELGSQEQQLLFLFRSSCPKLRQAILDQAYFLSLLIPSGIVTR